MKQNMGTTDKFIRIFIALAILALYFLGYISGTVAIILMAVAIVFLLVSLIGFCPLYPIFGINTCKKK